MKVLILGDSPHLMTGFGRVNAVAAKAFQDAGWQVGAVSGLTMDVVDDDKGITMFYPERGDVIGAYATPIAIEKFDPDLVYVTCEPGMLTAFSHVVPARLPFVAYVPIEGEPIVNQDWKQVLKNVNLITTSEYATKILENSCGITDAQWAYHGIDHGVFRVNGRRDYVRNLFGWDNKFVIMMVGANVRRKQHPRLFEAVAILKHHYKQNDVILYDHTVPFDGYWLEGWKLPEISAALGIYNEVVFNPALGEHNKYVPDVGLYDSIGLVDLYNAADLFVLPSQVEGFGLPIAEAMACGVPVMVTKYAAGWEVASPAGVPIPVKDWEVHKSGTRYANADVEGMAREILRLKRNPRERARRSALGLQRVRDFRWEDFTEKLIATANKAVSEKIVPKEVQTSGNPQEPEDQGQEQKKTTTDGSHENQAKTRIEKGEADRFAEGSIRGKIGEASPVSTTA